MQPVSGYLPLAKYTVIEALRPDSQKSFRGVYDRLAPEPRLPLMALFSVITNEPLNRRKFNQNLSHGIYKPSSRLAIRSREIRALLRLTITKLLPHCRP
jgi:hypothetical protein